MLDFLKGIFGDPAQGRVKEAEHLVDLINRFELELESLTDEELRAKTDYFKAELANRPSDPNPKIDKKLEEEALEFILPEAFAVVREASKRVLGMRHYDVQMIGGIILHQGQIAEMRTGEGKTLVATLPAYLNALTGKGVHVITVNDYLARRDAEWMGKLYTFLGLTVGTVMSQGTLGSGDYYADKKAAYAADITYGTNNEFGFDFLRDHMANTYHQVVQRPYHFAIVDEVDSILIDEARTPLIISGRVQQSAELYHAMAKLAPRLKRDEDYTVDEKSRLVVLTEEGIDAAQAALGVDELFDPKTNLAHHVLCALKAKELFRKDIDYVVKDNAIIIVDEFTGRLMEGRRWSDGIHQAVEAKEGVEIQDETQTLASITFQNLFRLYPKLAGMTGTATTEATEFEKIYSLKVTPIPTNQVDSRKDLPDVIYKTEPIKFYRVVEDIIERHEKGQPVLVGTTSIERSEWLATLLSNPKDLIQHLKHKSERLVKYLDTDGDAVKSHLAAFLQPSKDADIEEWEALLEDPKTKDDYKDYLKGMIRTLNTIRCIEAGVPFHVLNAKHHEQEAAIIAQAGRYQAITIATNMAGRGTDIVLGGNPEALAKADFESEGLDWRGVDPVVLSEKIAAKKVITDAEKEKVLEAGGLHIIGTERHESRRIDNQLRGRAARQGDPGSTQFYLSLEDSLMRIFGGQKVSGLMDVLNVDETMPIAAPMVSKVIEGSQRKVEAYHFDIRKSIIRFDDVLTQQRKLIYEQRHHVLIGTTLRDDVAHMIQNEMERLVHAHVPPNSESADWPEGCLEGLLAHLHIKVPQLANLTEAQLPATNDSDLVSFVQSQAMLVYEAMENNLIRTNESLNDEHGITLMAVVEELPVAKQQQLRAELDDEQWAHYVNPLRRVEREIMLAVIDAQWVDYLHNLEALREGIGLRAYGQKDPLLEYKREAFDLFQNLSFAIQGEVVDLLFRANIEIQIDPNSLSVDSSLLDGLPASEAISPPEIMA